ncbi:hypothetical protein [Holospora curviuscula]|uniref:hypothetical protein n=1 Tax=Holospora curviuscula TaxID=1082868 RepID=UPI0013FD5315|nr:hypothetical protein [Holospora curviuscula]
MPKLPGLVNNAALTEKKINVRKHHSIVDKQGTLVYGTVHEVTQHNTVGKCNIF